MGWGERHGRRNDTVALAEPGINLRCPDETAPRVAPHTDGCCPTCGRPWAEHTVGVA